MSEALKIRIFSGEHCSLLVLCLQVKALDVREYIQHVRHSYGYSIVGVEQTGIQSVPWLLSVPKQNFVVVGVRRAHVWVKVWGIPPTHAHHWMCSLYILIYLSGALTFCCVAIQLTVTNLQTALALPISWLLSHHFVPQTGLHSSSLLFKYCPQTFNSNTVCPLL